MMSGRLALATFTSAATMARVSLAAAALLLLWAAGASAQANETVPRSLKVVAARFYDTTGYRQDNVSGVAIPTRKQDSGWYGAGAETTVAPSATAHALLSPHPGRMQCCSTRLS